MKANGLRNVTWLDGAEKRDDWPLMWPRRLAVKDSGIWRADEREQCVAALCSLWSKVTGRRQSRTNKPTSWAHCLAGQSQQWKNPWWSLLEIQRV